MSCGVSHLLWKKSSLLGGEQFEGVRDKADEKKPTCFLGGQKLICLALPQTQQPD